MNSPQKTASPATTRGPEIRLVDVSLAIGQSEVLKNITLAIKPGEIHALIGPNGAGKTTLLRSLLGQHAHRGKIEIAWLDAPKGRIGYVPQTLDFDRHTPVTASDFLGLMSQRRPTFFGLKQEVRQHILEDLAAVGLDKRSNSPLGTLSGGELKRLLVAQALRPVPHLLILDEPMNHLDAKGVALVGALLRKLSAEGTTVLLTLHDLAHARELAHTVTAMNAGRIRFSGSPAVVLTQAAVLELYTKDVPPEEDL